MICSRDSDWVKVLLSWFYRYGRRYEWRIYRDWYRTLVAEYMLVRTRSENVEKVYGEFIERFPTPETLCRADTIDVEKFFKKLGLLYRARKIREAVCMIIKKYSGRIPCNFRELVEISGVGRYIANVILTKVCRMPTPFIDVNVARFIKRFLGIDRIDIETAEKLLRDTIAIEYLEEVNTAIIDLSAAICRARNPRCSICPIADWCKQFEETTKTVKP